MLSIRMLALSLFGLAIMVAALSLTIARAQLEKPLQGDADEPYFPEVAGRNVNEESYKLPSGFEGQYNLLLLAFTQRQQSAVNTWLDEMRTPEKQYSQFRVYELPTLPAFPQWQQQQLDNWMSAVISDPLSRERTITLYTDVDAMRQALNIGNTSRIRLFLVDRSGKVYWRGEGAYSKEQFGELSDIVSSLRG